jgi:hypothetical protein
MNYFLKTPDKIEHIQINRGVSAFRIYLFLPPQIINKKFWCVCHAYPGVIVIAVIGNAAELVNILD